MPKYGVYFNSFVTSTNTFTAVGLHANATGELFELVEAVMTGSKAAAADRMHEAFVVKSTFGAAGTGTVTTAVPFDDFSRAANILSTIEFSAEPTTVGTVFPVYFGFNQRGGMRWAVPRLEGLWMYNANADKGVQFQCASDAAGSVSGHVQWWEP